MALVLALFTYDEFGITWDESVQSHYGELVLDYFQSGLTDVRCNNFLNLKFYGPMFELACAMAYQWTPEIKFEIRHLCIAITGLLTLPALIKFSQLFRDPLVPIFAPLALTMLPRFIGHSFNNSKDIPFACFFVWAMYSIARLITGTDRSSRQWLYCGIAIGLALGIRIGGIILYVFFLLSLAFIGLANLTEYKTLKFSRTAWIWLNGAAFVFILSWMVMVILWPWAHQNLVVNPLKAFMESANFQFQRSLVFEGERVLSTELPWYYLFKYLLITIPSALLVFTVLGVILSIRIQIKRFHSSEAVVSFITQIWLFVPLVYFVIQRPNIYDGMRHFLFILPAVAVFIGVASANIYRILKAYVPSQVSFCLILFSILLPAKDIVALHPYQMTYFNSLAGGLEQASRDYETDYWLSSYKEAAQWIVQHTAATGANRTQVLLAANNNSRVCADYYLSEGKNIQSHTIFKSGIPGRLPDKFDYYIATTRYGLNGNFPDTPVIHTIGRDNAIFTVIKSGKNTQQHSSLD